MKTAADQYMFIQPIQPIQPGAPSIAPRKNIPVADISIKKERRAAIERPPSPFMFPRWCGFQITSVLSIVHRFTGIALAVGSVLLAG
jgi:hypothetical protein